MPALLFVTGSNEELIKHFCQLEDMIEHNEDKYGRVITAGDVEYYVFEMISDWYPKFNELYDYRLTNPKLHDFLHILIINLSPRKEIRHLFQPF